ncbi:MAG: hypothetical protein AB7K71_20845 [Polyangiaceae bacterium]
MTPELEELLQEAKSAELRVEPSEGDRERVRHRLRLAIGGGAALATTGVASKASASAASASAASASAASASAASASAASAELGTIGGASFLSGVSGLKLAGWLLVGSALGLGGAWTSQGLLGVERPSVAPASKATLETGRALTPGDGPAPEVGRSVEAAAVAAEQPVVKSPALPGPPRAAALRAAAPLQAAAPEAAPRRNAAGAQQGTSGAPAGSASAPGILEELRRLRAAEAALSRGDLAGAQQELDTTRGSELAPERLGLSAITACRRGDKRGAEQLHALLLARFPATPILPRVRAEIAMGCSSSTARKTSTDP